MRLSAGDVTGDYIVLELAGCGGMGEVYKVRHRLSGSIEALKIVRGPSAADSASRLTREIQLLATLNHPHIAALHNAFERDNEVCMVMEFVEGTPLSQIILQGPVQLDDIVSYLSQTLAALEYAHGRGVIHRDIKPNNIIVSPHGVKLLDFGIAAPEMAGSAGVAMGTAYYLSPEQAEGRPTDARSDLYSTGVVMYELLTGRRPFEGPAVTQILAAHLHSDPPPITLRPGFPEALSAICLRSLRKDPALRFPSAEAFQAALDAVPLRNVDRSARAREETQPVMTAAPPVSPMALAALERTLIDEIGPIGRQVLTRAQGRAAPELCDLLVRAVPTARQEAFRQQCRAVLGISATQPSKPDSIAPSGSGSRFDPATLERASRSLSAYIGPLAKVIVAKKAKQALGVDELYAELAKEIASERDRVAFLTAPR
jgi:serine/threonine-protein kinase